MTAGPFDDGWTNVMFVGRVIPNKKFEDVIRAFHVYRTRHNPRSRLLLVGSYGGFEKYLAMLHALVARLGTPDVHFLGHVSNEELTALYDVADLFLCASEHEGFCVPLIESFYKRVPVLAYAATAVPATMDGGGVLYDTKDPFDVARLMAALLDDADLEDAVDRHAGRRAGSPAGQGLRRHAAAVRRPGARHRPASGAGSPLRLLGDVRPGRAARGAAPVPAGDLPGAAASDVDVERAGRAAKVPRSNLQPPTSQPPTSMRIHQWVPAAHRGDAIGDSARTVREMLRGHGPRLGDLRADDRRRPARRRAALLVGRGDAAATSRSSTSPCRRR